MLREALVAATAGERPYVVVPRVQHIVYVRKLLESLCTDAGLPGKVQIITMGTNPDSLRGIENMRLFVDHYVSEVATASEWANVERLQGVALWSQRGSAAAKPLLVSSMPDHTATLLPSP